jgi:hypothetical protein
MVEIRTQYLTNTSVKSCWYTVLLGCMAWGGNKQKDKFAPRSFSETSAVGLQQFTLAIPADLSVKCETMFKQRMARFVSAVAASVRACSFGKPICQEFFLCAKQTQHFKARRKYCWCISAVLSKMNVSGFKSNSYKNLWALFLSLNYTHTEWTFSL